MRGMINLSFFPFKRIKKRIPNIEIQKNGSILHIHIQFFGFFKIFIIDFIKVERPVSWPPPHRSLRAVFPHKAPRHYSLRTKAWINPSIQRFVDEGF